MRRSVRIIFNRCYFSQDPVFISLKINNTVSPLMPSTTPANSNSTQRFTAGPSLTTFGQRLFWIPACQFSKVIARHCTPTWSRRFICFSCHAIFYLISHLYGCIQKLNIFKESNIRPCLNSQNSLLNIRSPATISTH